jgi:glutamate/tyrosine decarboxylase-like PLP-dependent enzyme
VAAFRAALDEMLDLAGLAADRLAGIGGVTVLSEPELSVVVFRATASDDATDQIVGAINASGRFHVASTTLDGHACVRLAFLNPATTRAHVEDVTDLIGRAAAG